VKGRNIYTPSLDDGCLDGVMRSKIIGIALNLNYIVFEDAHINETNLLDADELFLTNAINGIKWVGAYKTKRFYNDSAKLFISVLNKF
jgi:branched-chain amino acid aminotransferase